MDQRGRVISVNTDGTSEVAIIRESACGGGCATCGNDCSSSEMTITVSGKSDIVEVGDIVRIEASTKKMLISAFTAYVIPLIFLVLGTILGASIMESAGNENYEIIGFFIGLLSLAISFFVIRFLGDKLNKDKSNFEIVEIIKKR